MFSVRLSPPRSIHVLSVSSLALSLCRSVSSPALSLPCRSVTLSLCRSGSLARWLAGSQFPRLLCLSVSLSLCLSVSSLAPSFLCSFPSLLLSLFLSLCILPLCNPVPFIRTRPCMHAAGVESLWLQRTSDIVYVYGALDISTGGEYPFLLALSGALILGNSACVGGGMGAAGHFIFIFIFPNPIPPRAPRHPVRGWHDRAGDRNQDHECEAKIPI